MTLARNLHAARRGLAALALLALGYTLAPAPAKAADVTIRIGQCCAPEQAYGVYAHGFADKMEKASDGRIKVEVLDGGVMGSEQEMAQQVQLGTLQMGAITSNNVAQLAPSLNVLVLPYLNSSMEELVGDGGLLRPGPYRDELNKRVLAESGSVQIIGGYTNSFRKLFTRNTCVETLGDLQGLKIRIPKNPVMEKMWAAWGVSTYPIAWSETFGAIQQGVVDAFDSPLDVIPRMGYYEHINYVIDTHYLPQAALLIVNKPWLDSLSQEDRDLIMKIADENDVWHYNWVKNDQETLKNNLISEHGTTFCELKDADEWKKKAQAIWPELYSLVGGGKDWVDTTLHYKETGEMAN
ncbi:TRAP transporter substrate-binding protein [Afifella sp. IM 167]|uniref:TRAP transporter substrate-binding protein n=1 Tax=Afifella sp. IM 167 TaxID=2033586 RepID=UPI001CCD24A4|nr:TRAP transporter substrate-binding protein [Afifella sp. IM 167]MBZ8135164.1 hypothetical protein [Afifella sp. IM 167]